MTLDPRKDGLKRLELRLGIEVVKLRENAALVDISESAGANAEEESRQK